MNTDSLTSRSWNDLVFENRNKDYGAYYVRKSYSRNMVTAFGISITFAASLILSPELLRQFNGKESSPPFLEKKKTDSIVFVLPPVIPQPPVITPPPTAAPPPARTIANLPPVVTPEDVDTNFPEQTEIVNSMSTSTEGNGTIYDPQPPIGVIETPEPVPTGPVTFAEVMPSFDGGLEAMIKYLKRNLRYPRSASQVGTEGSVYVSFVVDGQGHITDVSLVRGLSADCDKEAMRVIAKMPAWKPGMQNHHPVSVKMVLPIKYQLD